MYNMALNGNTINIYISSGFSNSMYKEEYKVLNLKLRGKWKTITQSFLYFFFFFVLWLDFQISFFLSYSWISLRFNKCLTFLFECHFKMRLSEPSVMREVDPNLIVMNYSGNWFSIILTKHLKMYTKQSQFFIAMPYV